MVALLGFALPGTVLGIGYVLAFNEPPLHLTGTFWILVINCAAHYLAVAVEAGLGKLAQIDPSPGGGVRGPRHRSIGTSSGWCFR